MKQKLILLTAVLLSCLLAEARAAVTYDSGDTFDYQGVSYKVVDAAARTVETISLANDTLAIDSLGVLVLPEKLHIGENAYTVVGIGEYSFQGNLKKLLRSFFPRL